MKSSVSKLFAFLALVALCLAAFPAPALAKPVIKYSVEHVYMHEAGEVEVVGSLHNDGDRGAYAKWIKIDLTLIADNGQQMWADSDIVHETGDIYLDPGDAIEYTFYIQNPDIPEYHGKYRWRYHTSTHWETAAG